MAYRNTLQADALKLVAQKLQSSLAVEGELPDDGLAAYGDDGDDLMLALARKLVAGEEDPDAEAVEDIFAQAQQVAADAESLLGPVHSNRGLCQSLGNGLAAGLMGICNSPMHSGRGLRRLCRHRAEIASCPRDRCWRVGCLCPRRAVAGAPYPSGSVPGTRCTCADGAGSTRASWNASSPSSSAPNWRRSSSNVSQTDRCECRSTARA